MINLLKKLSIESSATFLIRGASIAFLLTALGTATSFFSRVMLARLMDPKAFGNYTYAYSWSTVLMFIGVWGFDTAALRYFSSYYGNAKWGYLRGFLRYSQFVVIVVSSAIGVAVILIVVIFRKQMPEDLFYSLLITAALIPPSAMLWLTGRCLLAMQNVFWAEAPHLLIRSVAFIIVVWVGMGTGFLPRTAVTATSGFCLITIVLAVFSYTALYQRIPSETWRTGPQYDRKTWNGAVIQFAVLSIAAIANARIDIIMVGFMIDIKHAGIYAVAVTIMGIIDFGLGASNNIIGPMTAMLFSQSKMDELQHLVSLSAYGVATYSLALTAILLIGGNYILRLFGETYTLAYTSLIVLAVGKLVNSFSGPVGLLLNMTGHQKKSTQFFLVSLGMNFVLNLIFIPLLGITGSAIATTIALISWNILLLIEVRRLLNINPTIFPIRVPKWHVTT